MVLVAPKLSGAAVCAQLLKHLAKCQMDEVPAIRVNTNICLGKIAPHLEPGVSRPWQLHITLRECCPQTVLSVSNLDVFSLDSQYNVLHAGYKMHPYTWGIDLSSTFASAVVTHCKPSLRQRSLLIMYVVYYSPLTRGSCIILIQWPALVVLTITTSNGLFL